MLFRYLVLAAGLLVSSVNSAATFELDAESGVIGHNMVVFSRSEDTLLDIARQFDLGYNDIVNANPDVDPWLPGDNTRVILPTRFILPDAPRQGIVINVAELRLFYYPKVSQGQTQTVITHPIGIGREGWATPLGQGRITQKIKDPSWTPPESIRKEHLEKGDPLPRVVPAGPNNPLGAYAMRLSIPGYLLHGTDKPFGVGMRVSHGCIRLFPEDIEHMFSVTPENTPVNIVYQPYKAGVKDGQLFLASHPPLQDMDQREGNNMTPMVSAILKAQDKLLTDDEWPAVERLVRENKGVVHNMHRAELDIIEDLWFVHAGFNTKAQAKIRQAITKLNMVDLFWPISDSAKGETLIGPFNTAEAAAKKAQELTELAGTAVWVVQVSSDAL